MKKLFQKSKNRYARHGWYKQAAAVKLLYIGYPWLACFDFTVNKKPAKLFYQGMMVYIKGDYMDVYFPRPTMAGITDFYFTKRPKALQFLRQLKSNWEKTSIKKYFSALKRFHSISLEKLNNSQILKLYLEFSAIYHEVWSESIFLDAFDATGDQILEDALRSEGKAISDQELHVLTSVEHFSWLQKEKKSLLNLIALAKRNQKLIKLLGSNPSVAAVTKSFPDFYRKLTTHCETYHWIYNDYAIVRYLDEKETLKIITHFLKHSEQIKKEQGVLAEVGKITAQKRKIIKKYKLSRKLQECIASLTLLAEWRDTRKSCNQMAGNVLQKFAKEFSKRTNLPLETVENFFWWELKDVFHLKKDAIHFNYQRKKGCLINGNPQDKKHTLLGKQAEDLHKFMDGLIISSQGMTGRPAYPGMVTGTVKIIRSQNEFHKMNKGDILVAPNTRPEYVPLMKIAGAIISEEGGLTCHTAIVSRELKKPAIVGAQGIILKLHDGDKVEVDASKGIIKKLNS